MEIARIAYRDGEYRKCLATLVGLSRAEFQAERELLRNLCLLELARQARLAGKNPYCLELLQQCREQIADCPYLQEELKRKWLMEAAAASGEKEQVRLALQIPGEDEVLLLRARGALGNGEYERAGRLLDSADDRESWQWNWLRGEVWFAQKNYADAVKCYEKACSNVPKKTAERLEICYREMGNYKMAYYYAKLEN